MRVDISLVKLYHTPRELLFIPQPSILRSPAAFFVLPLTISGRSDGLIAIAFGQFSFEGGEEGGEDASNSVIEANG